ncbi:MAG TPA: hypothetical protein VGC42_04900 [Kofleriaceae bacterium]
MTARVVVMTGDYTCVATSPRGMLRAMQRAAWIAITALAACGGSPATVGHHAGAAAGEIRGVDWQNRTYDVDELGPVAVHAGQADFAITEDGKAAAAGPSRGSYRVAPPLFADLDGDGVEDAVIASVTGLGGTGMFSQIELFTIRDHKVAPLGAIPGGDRGDGGIRKVSLAGAALIVERNVLAEGDGTCCASTYQVERWVWKRGGHGEMAEDTAARKPPVPIPEP